MHYYPEDQSPESVKKIRRSNCCAVCGRQLAVYLDPDKRIYIACSGGVHEGIAREYQPQREDYESNIRRSTELEKKVGLQNTRALATIPKQGQLTQPQAEHILSLVYPNVPREEVIRCAILCRDFGLHPLMKEVYIIPFGQGEKRTWATVLGINATRKLMSQRGSYSYLDMTPRIMTAEEQKTIFGEIDEKNIVAITKLRNRTGEEAPGYGRWPKDTNPYGMDKGNTKANMAFIRSERNAFGRLFTDAIPQGVDIVDEAYVDGIGEVDKTTGEILEKARAEVEVNGEFREVEEEPEGDLNPEPEEKSSSLIDYIIWLKESIKTLQKTGQKAYSDESMLGYMKSSYSLEGKDIYEIAEKLDKGKAAHFANVIQDALNKV